MIDKKGIVARLREHLSDEDGCLNDGTVNDLYREYHGIPDGEETDLETVEQWAYSKAQPNRVS